MNESYQTAEIGSHSKFEHITVDKHDAYALPDLKDADPSIIYLIPDGSMHEMVCLVTLPNGETSYAKIGEVSLDLENF